MNKRQIPGHSPLVAAAATMMLAGVLIGLPYLEGHTMSLIEGAVLFTLGAALMVALIIFFEPRR